MKLLERNYKNLKKTLKQYRKYITQNFETSWYKFCEVFRSIFETTYKKL